MSTTNLTSGEVMNRVAALMNDIAMTQYNYITMLPYLNMAIDDLQGAMQLHNIPATEDTATYITLTAGLTQITPAEDILTPHYPSDLISIREISERTDGSTDTFVPLKKNDFLNPRELTYALRDWAWLNQRIKFIGALSDREIKLDYIREVVTEAADETTVIGIINSRSYLAFKTAEYCSRYIGENPTRADTLKEEAEGALDEFLGIETKAKQNQQTRRRPFRSAYKSRYRI